MIWKPEELEKVSCDFCKADMGIHKFTRADGMRVVECHRCGLAYLQPRPRRELISRFYDSDYFTGVSAERGKGGLKRGHVTISSHEIDGYNPRVVMLIKEKIGNLSGMRILEIGCATGDLLLWLKREGSYTHGLEISEYASEIARKRGLEITTGTIESFGQDVRCLFDLIIAFEVIEHVPSPVIFLEKVAEHIRPGGHLMLSTPNYSCAKRYGNQWYGFTESFEHIYFFSRDILERIAGQAGLILTYWESSMFSGDTSRMPGFLDRQIDRCARLALMSQEIGFPKALRLAWKRALNYLPYGNGHKLLVVFQKEPVTDR